MRPWCASLRLAVSITLTCALAGCSGSDNRSAAGDRSVTVIQPGKPGEPNKTFPAATGTVIPPGAADIRFVQMMIPHHEQALEMAVLAPRQATSAKVKALAERIDAAQSAEISRMQSWLRQNGQSGQGGGHGGGHGAFAPETMRMPGMATPQQMSQLKDAAGTSFDRLFLTLMITHHEGALTMANEELTKGTDVLIQEMAQDVVVTQTAEINRMRGLL